MGNIRDLRSRLRFAAMSPWSPLHHHEAKPLCQGSRQLPVFDDSLSPSCTVSVGQPLEVVAPHIPQGTVHASRAPLSVLRRYAPCIQYSTCTFKKTVRPGRRNYKLRWINHGPPTPPVTKQSAAHVGCTLSRNWWCQWTL